MGQLLYEWMTQRQAADALDEFLTERSGALQRLRRALSAHGVSAAEVLDGSVDSVAPLWEWITVRITELGVDPRSLEQDPTRPSWPSWARHGMLVDPHPPAKTLAWVDGFTSYLARVITAAVPETRWLVGEHLLEDYPLRNYPVLAAGGHQIFLPGIPLYSAYQSAHGRDPMDGTEMGGHLRRTLTAMRGQGPVADAVEEMLVTVVPEVGCFDVGLRADIAAEHPGLVEQLILELRDRQGVVSIHRYGPDALVIDVPDWDEIRLKLWLTLWLQRHLHTDD
jgi:hypothetical protein